MGSEYVDPGWGALGTSFFKALQDAPQKALSSTMTAEQIVALRAEQQRKRDEFEINNRAGAAFGSALPTAPPMSAREIMVQPEGPVNPEDPATLGQTFLPPVARQEQYLDPAVAERFKNEREFLAATGRAQAHKNSAELVPLFARGVVGLTGMPADPERLRSLEFMSKGEFDKTKADNWLAVDPVSGAVKAYVGASKDGVRDVMGRDMNAIKPEGTVLVRGGERGITPPAPGAASNWVLMTPNGVVPNSIMSSPTKPPDPPGARYVHTSAAPQAPEDTVGTPAARIKFITDYTDKVVGDDYQLTPKEAIRLAIAMEEQYGVKNKLMADAKGNITQFTGFQEVVIPGVQKKLAEAVNKVLLPLVGTTQAAAAPGQPTPAPTPPLAAASPAPMTTQVVSAGESKDAIARTASAVGRAETARKSLEAQIGVVNGQLPAVPYVPNLGAAIIAEKNNGIVGGALISAIDPKAPQYLADSKAWVEAVLRLASGAAIRTEEYSDYAQMFVPNRNDNHQQIEAKLKRMQDWAQITASAQTAEEAHKMLMNVSKGDPVFQDMAIKLRNLAEQNGTLNTPFTQLPQPGQTAAPAGGPDPSVVNRILGITR